MQTYDLADILPGQRTTARLWSAALGPYETNAYLYTPDGRHAWIIDPGMGPAPIIEQARHENLAISAILLTHAHADHILGLGEVLEAFPSTPVLIHEAEEDWPSDPALNLSAGMGAPFSAPSPTGTFVHGDTLAIGDESWGVRHTPGHSPGGCVFVAPGGGLAIVGDTLFHGSIGRTDLPGGDFDTLADSIRREIYSLDASCLCLPGHGPATTVGHERLHNPFVRR